MFGIHKIPAAQFKKAIDGLAAMAGHPVYVYAAAEYGAGWYWVFPKIHEGRDDKPVYVAI